MYGFEKRTDAAIGFIDRMLTLVKAESERNGINETAGWEPKKQVPGLIFLPCINVSHFWRFFLEFCCAWYGSLYNRETYTSTI